MKKRLKLATFAKSTPIWQANPGGMITKCAEADALRSSFPTSLGGMYLREEMHVGDQPLSAPRPSLGVQAATEKLGNGTPKEPEKTVMVETEIISAPVEPQRDGGTPNGIPDENAKGTITTEQQGLVLAEMARTGIQRLTLLHMFDPIINTLEEASMLGADRVIAELREKPDKGAKK